jgi:hypothetical protein
MGSRTIAATVQGELSERLGESDRDNARRRLCGLSWGVRAGPFFKELQLIDITTRLAYRIPCYRRHVAADGRAIHLITSYDRRPFHRYGTELSLMIKGGCHYAVNDSHPGSCAFGQPEQIAQFIAWMKH